MKTEILEIKVFITAIFTMINSVLGILATPIYILMFLNLLDYITGMWSATKKGELITSSRSYDGIKKKIGMYILIIVGFIVDWLLQFTVITLRIDLAIGFHLVSAITIWLIVSELISLVENLYDIGVVLPSFLMPLLKKIKNIADMEAKEESEEEKLARAKREKLEKFEYQGQVLKNEDDFFK